LVRTGHDLVRGSGSNLRLAGYFEEIFGRKFQSLFAVGASVTFVPALWWSVAVGGNVVHRLWIVAMVVAITNYWGFVWFGHFALLVELEEVLNLEFAEFWKLII
jgi:hypothetical protein